MHRNLDHVSTKRRRIAELAKQSPEMVFTSLAHHMDLDWLLEAYRRTRKDGATGIDAMTAADYAVGLEDNLRSLVNRAKSGQYQAPPVRRVHIPKGTSGATRPIGIPTFEDKVLQRAVVLLLESIYEQDFSNSSYGFRPRRSAHEALQSFWEQATRLRGCWVLEVDISKFFDNLDHDQLRLLLRRRVCDGVLLRLIDKWLRAGVMEEGKLSFPDSGSPQGGVIAPPTILPTRLDSGIGRSRATGFVPWGTMAGSERNSLPSKVVGQLVNLFRWGVKAWIAEGSPLARQQ